MKKFILILSLVLSGCGGGGGGTSTSDSSQAVSVKSSCALTVQSSAVPQSYYGTNSIPAPLSKFDNTILRGIGLKDYHPRFSVANTNKQVSGDTRFSIQFSPQVDYKLNPRLAQMIFEPGVHQKSTSSPHNITDKSSYTSP